MEGRPRVFWDSSAIISAIFSRSVASLVHRQESFLKSAGLGIVVGADGTMGLAVCLVRIPDASVLLRPSR